ncbi:MAG TPA: helix-turn-helix transcriptional regulator [Longimicrobium sp.]|nr:helix-turn-helix transcriptional regulator [Longimicrobium sp.]
MEIEESSGNVFADLGLDDPEELLAKSTLTHLIVGIIQRKKLTQRAAAELLETTQPIVSDLFRGRIDKFSFERLMVFLTRLGQDVAITVRPRPRTRARAVITVRTLPPGRVAM